MKTRLQQFEEQSSPATDNGNENVIHFINNEKEITFTFSQPRYVTKIKKLALANPKDVIITHENADGSIVGKMPVKYLKIGMPRKVSDEQKEIMRERMMKMRENIS